MYHNLQNSVKTALKHFGQTFTVWYRTSTACNCSGISDPIYGGLTEYNCSTCNGSGLVWASTAYQISGILKQFATGLNYIENGNYKTHIGPVGISRGTFWLDDVLVNVHSVSGSTYFTNCHTVDCNGYLYKPKNQTRVGPYGE